MSNTIKTEAQIAADNAYEAACKLEQEAYIAKVSAFRSYGPESFTATEDAHRTAQNLADKARGARMDAYKA